MTSPCDTCRFATANNGCDVGLCAVVRSELRGRGVSVPPAERTVTCPERMTPEGVISLKVGARTFPPTVQGFREARAAQANFERCGARIALTPIFRFDKEPISGPLHLWDGDKPSLIEFWHEDVNRKAVTA